MVKNTRRAYKNLQNFERIKKKYVQENVAKKPKAERTKPGPSFKTKRVSNKTRNTDYLTSSFPYVSSVYSSYISSYPQEFGSFKADNLGV